MDSALEFLFVFGALGVWVVQRLVKRSRQQAARETAAEAGADLAHQFGVLSQVEGGIEIH